MEQADWGLSRVYFDDDYTVQLRSSSYIKFLLCFEFSSLAGFISSDGFWLFYGLMLLDKGCFTGSVDFGCL